MGLNQKAEKARRAAERQHAATSHPDRDKRRQEQHKADADAGEAYRELMQPEQSIGKPPPTSPST